MMSVRKYKEDVITNIDYKFRSDNIDYYNNLKYIRKRLFGSP